MGGICRESQECFLYAVPDRTETTLINCIKASIKPGTTIITDCWRSYCNIEKIPDMNYKHMTVNHSKNFVDPISGACTNLVEGMWNICKMKNKKMWGLHRSMVDSYMCEFMFRRRNQNSSIFDCIMKEISLQFPLK